MKLIMDDIIDNSTIVLSSKLTNSNTHLKKIKRENWQYKLILKMKIQVHKNLC